MHYFRWFPQIQYSPSSNIKSLSKVSATDIMVRVKIKEFLKESLVSTVDYEIPDGFRPDTVAEKYYGDPKYVWVLFYANDIYDPIMDWPLDGTSFNNYIEHKYSTAQGNGYFIASNTVHEYYLENGLITTFDVWANAIVDNVNSSADSEGYEDIEVGDIIKIGNENKITIKVLAIDTEGTYKRVSAFEIVPNTTTNEILSVPSDTKFLKTKLQWEEETNRAKKTIKVIEPVFLRPLLEELKIKLKYTEE